MEKSQESDANRLEALSIVSQMIYQPGMESMVNTLTGMAENEGKIDAMSTAVGDAISWLRKYFTDNNIDIKYAMMVVSGLLLIVCEGQVGTQLRQLKPMLDAVEQMRKSTGETMQ